MKKYLLIFVGVFFMGTLMAQSQDLIQITCYQGQKVSEVRPIFRRVVHPTIWRIPVFVRLSRGD